MALAQYPLRAMPTLTTSTKTACLCGPRVLRKPTSAQPPKTASPIRSNNLPKKSSVTGSLGAHQPNDKRINIYLVDFRHHIRITYNLAQKNIKVEDKRFRWDQFFTTLHARGGYQQDSFLNDLWAFVVDMISLSFIFWVASGIYMWWHLKQTRRWGIVALGSGFLSFVIFLVAL